GLPGLDAGASGEHAAVHVLVGKDQHAVIVWRTAAAKSPRRLFRLDRRKSRRGQRKPIDKRSGRRGRHPDRPTRGGGVGDRWTRRLGGGASRRHLGQRGWRRRHLRHVEQRRHGIFLRVRQAVDVVVATAAGVRTGQGSLANLQGRGPLAEVF